MDTRNTSDFPQANTINPDNYTIIQLCQWLRHLELPMSGNKAALVLRLTSLSAEERGECPTVETENTANESESEADSGSDAVSNVASNADADVNEQRELKLIKRERELVLRENEILKRELDFYKSRKESPVESQLGQSAPLNLIKELIADFDENSHFEFWAKQVRSVSSTYKLNDDIMRALIASKLKGKALSWLHNNINCATCGVEQLLTLMEDTYGTKESKMMLRQQFEYRKWDCNETFTPYFNEKIALANVLQLEEQELIDYIIEGIPDEQLKMQAFIRCFKAKAQLLQSFSKIQLKPKKVVQHGQLQQPTNVDKQNTRCFNCNSLGHWKAECRKPQREPGTCYGCGSRDHGVGDCPKRKPTVAYLEHNYGSLIKYCIVLDDKNFFIN